MIVTVSNYPVLVMGCVCALVSIRYSSALSSMQSSGEQVPQGSVAIAEVLGLEWVVSGLP